MDKNNNKKTPTSHRDLNQSKDTRVVVGGFRWERGKERVGMVDEWRINSKFHSVSGADSRVLETELWLRVLMNVCL